MHAGGSLRLNHAMSRKVDRLVSVEAAPRQDCSDELVVSCHLAKVPYIWSRRNAWGTTASNTFPAEAFFPSLAAARRAVERRRIQGSRWHIHERPALVACGDTWAVCVTEINEREPLRSFSVPDQPMRTLGDIAEYFRPSRPDSVFMFVCAPELLPIAEGPFRNHHSRSRGGRALPLEWSPAASGLRIHAVRQLIAAINETLHETARGKRKRG